ncbi:MAG: RHS repeat-associated core domain-containing protein [Chloroflexota bacterium]
MPIRKRTFSIQFIITFYFVLANITPTLAAPADPFTGASQSFDAAPPEASNFNVGDWGVADERGTATYTFPIEVPPGRNGMQPSLALRYSSNSPLRGGIAAGWTFDLPMIERDHSLGVDGGLHYKASLPSASGRLVKVDDKLPFDDAVAAYRVNFDTSFTRLFLRGDSVEGDYYWTALTTDGVQHHFAEKKDSAGESRWLIEEQTDTFGNTVNYFWSAVYGLGEGSLPPNLIDYRLDRIEYSANANAGLKAHAKVEFAYDPPQFCPNAQIPLGAAMRRGSTSVNGSSPPKTIETSVRDTQGDGWRLSRKVDLNYDFHNSTLFEDPLEIQPDDSNQVRQLDCQHNRLRYLNQIDVTAYDPDGNATDLPPLTFNYNRRIHTTRPLIEFGPDPLGTRSVNAPGIAEYGSVYGQLGSLKDVDGDGIRDRIAVIEENETCVFTWQKGQLGGNFADTIHKSRLPTFDWFYQSHIQNPNNNVTGKIDEFEHCTLTGQVVFREIYTPPDNNIPKPLYGRALQTYGYNFIDFTGDGRIDLLVTPLNPELAFGQLKDDYPEDFPAPRPVSTGGSDAPHKFTSWLYHNANERPEYNQLHNVQSVFSVQAFAVAAPVSMSAPGNPEVELGKQTTVASLPPNLVDLDGDGFLDLVELGQTWTRPVTSDCGGVVPVPDYRRPRWCVYFGRGGLTFSKAHVWYVPWQEGAIGSYSQTDFDDPTYHQQTWTVAGIADMTGDGLPDFVVANRDTGQLEAHLNTGSSFLDEPFLLNHEADALDRTQIDYRADGGVLVGDSGNRGQRRTLVDLDQDGLTDILTFVDAGPGDAEDITRPHKVFAAFNLGAAFSDPQELPQAWLPAKRLFAAEQGNWELKSDFVDVNGDGLLDLATWNGQTLNYISSPGLAPASDLLRSVENGRGMKITFDYKPTSDPEVVGCISADCSDSHLPHVNWVVSALEVDPGFDAPTMRTEYTYAEPRYLSTQATTNQPEPARFAGFRWTDSRGKTATDVTRRWVRTRYVHEALDPDGELVAAPHSRLHEQWTYRFKGNETHLHQYQVRSHSHHLLFGNAQTQVVLPSKTLTCTTRLDHRTPEQCMDQADHVLRTEQEWTGYEPSTWDDPIEACDPSTNSCTPNPTYEIFAKTADLRGVGTTPSIGDRRAEYAYQIRYGQSLSSGNCIPTLEGCQEFPDPPPHDYRVLLRKTTRYEQTAESEQQMVARVDTAYGTLTGRPLTTRVYQGEDLYAQTAYTHDEATGNRTGIKKPMQHTSNGSSNTATTFAHDSHKLYVDQTTNELGHEVHTQTDVATGALLQRQGPNRKGNVWDEERWAIDGFGRVLSHSTSIDYSRSYQLREVARYTYADRQFFNHNEAVYVETERLRDFSGERWIHNQQKMDGLGRVTTTVQHMPDGRRPTTTYRYDDLGNLRTLDVPDPSQADGNATVRYTYYYDSLGRLIRFARPDAGNGLSISYVGLQKTVHENAADGSGAIRVELYDAFGRLTELRESYPDTDDAITRYDYDANDNLSRIEDAEGNTTILTHDWVGNRTAISRGQRTWRYTYDLNGNLLSEVNPMPEDAAPEEYTVQYAYDDLDRITSVSYLDQRVSQSPEGTFGSERPELTPTATPSPTQTATATTSPIQTATATPSPTQTALPTLAPTVTVEPDPLGGGQTNDHAIYLPIVQNGTDRVPLVNAQSASLEAVSSEIYLPVVTETNTLQTSSATPPQVRASQLNMVQAITTISYTYDQNENGIGNLSRVDLPFGIIAYGYNARGLVTREERSVALNEEATLNATQWVERSYNALGLPKASTWDDGQRWRITYDGRGLVNRVEWTDPQSGDWQIVADFDRNLAGLPIVRKSSYGQLRTYGYDVLGRPTSDVTTVNDTEIASRGYTYSDSGDLLNVSGETNGVSAAASYSYDGQHRLLTASGPNGYSAAFNYSPTGNVNTANVTWNGSTETRDVSYVYGATDPQAVDQLTSADGSIYASFAYDLAGNMTWRSTPDDDLLLHWDGLDQIRVVETPNGTETYYYDHDQSRVLAVSESDGVRFWFGESETHYDLTGTQTKRYLHLSAGGPTLARVEDGSTIELQYADALQNLMFSLNAAGEVVASFLYGAFGEVVYSEGEENHRRQFNGKENDAVSGLRYYGYRYYDPLTLRWSSADPLYEFVPELGMHEPQRMNLYGFSLNNPVRYFDPDGRDANDTDNERTDSDGSQICEPLDRDTCELSDESNDNSDDNKNNGAMEEEVCTIDIMCELENLEGDGEQTSHGAAAGPRGYQGQTGHSIGGDDPASPEEIEEMKKEVSIIKQKGKAATPAELKRKKALQKRLKQLNKRKSKIAHSADKSNRSSATRTATKVVAGVSAGYVGYRIIRFLPSLLPPLWGTIPANAAIP